MYYSPSRGECHQGFSPRASSLMYTTRLFDPFPLENRIRLLAYSTTPAVRSAAKRTEDNSEGSEESLPRILRFVPKMPARLDCRSVASGYPGRLSTSETSPGRNEWMTLFPFTDLDTYYAKILFHHDLVIFYCNTFEVFQMN